jgi:hypothetical protein
MLQAEAFAIGLPPSEFENLSLKEIFRCFEGAAIARRRERQGQAWHAWHVANFTNAKKLPDLASVLRKLEPAENRVMSAKAQHQTILGLAAAFGAEVVYLKKGETLQ